MSRPDKYIDVDFKRQETEERCNEIIDDFALVAAPNWFNWLSWILSLAALEYLLNKVTEKQDYIAIILIISILVVSHSLLWQYFFSFFYRFRFNNLPLIRFTKNDRLTSSILSGLIAFGSWHLTRIIAKIVAQHT